MPAASDFQKQQQNVKLIGKKPTASISVRREFRFESSIRAVLTLMRR